VKFKILTFTKLREKSKIGEVFVGEIPNLFADLGFLPHMTSPISAFFPFSLDGKREESRFDRFSMVNKTAG